MMVWSEGSAGPIQLLAQPFDTDWNPLGPPKTFAVLPGPNPPALAMAAAPGGDFIVVWDDAVDYAKGSLVVQSIGPDGVSEGASTVLATLDSVSDQRLLVVVSPLGAMVVYEGDVPNYGIEVYAVPLACAS
jgi:hypothetical protein